MYIILYIRHVDGVIQTEEYININERRADPCLVLFLLISYHIA